DIIPDNLSIRQRSKDRAVYNRYRKKESCADSFGVSLMAHREHNRPKSGGMALIVGGILIFIFAPSYFKQNLVEGLGPIIAGFALGGIGFYLTFLKKKNP